MSRFANWLEDNYYYIVMIVVIVVFAFGGIGTCSDGQKNTDEAIANTVVVSERNKEKDANRSKFFTKYRRVLSQFQDENDFSFWLNNRANYEAVILLYDSITILDNEYNYEGGIADMIEYLGWSEPDIKYKYEYE